MEATPNKGKARLGDPWSTAHSKAARTRKDVPIIFAGLLLTTIAGCVSLATVIPPTDHTRTHLAVNKQRLQDYWADHGKLPAQLTDMPTQPNRDGSIDDGWGRPIVYRQLPDNKAVLCSFGRDGVPGGTGEDADLEETFQATPQG